MVGVLLNDDRWEEALEMANAAIRLEADKGDIHAAAGSVLLRMGRPGEALSEYDIALQLCPTMVEWHTYRGAALNLLGRHAEAVAEFEFLTNIDPGYFRRWPDNPLLPYYEAAKSNRVADISEIRKQEDPPSE